MFTVSRVVELASSTRGLEDLGVFVPRTVVPLCTCKRGTKLYTWVQGSGNTNRTPPIFWYWEVTVSYLVSQYVRGWLSGFLKAVKSDFSYTPTAVSWFLVLV